MASLAKKKLRLVDVVSTLVLVITIGLVALFLGKAGLFASLFTKTPQPVANMPLPEQVSSGVSTITGFDKDNQPYEMKALSVLQDKTNSDLAHLTTVSGYLRKKTGAVMKLTSKAGAYEKKKRILDLIGNVKLISQGQYTAYLEKARVTLKEKRLYAKVPVKVVFAQGTIHSNGVDITDNGARVLFFGGVKTHFDASSQKDTSSLKPAASGGKTDKQGKVLK